TVGIGNPEACHPHYTNAAGSFYIPRSDAYAYGQNEILFGGSNRYSPEEKSGRTRGAYCHQGFVSNGELRHVSAASIHPIVVGSFASDCYRRLICRRNCTAG